MRSLSWFLLFLITTVVTVSSSLLIDLVLVDMSKSWVETNPSDVTNVALESGEAFFREEGSSLLENVSLVSNGVNALEKANGDVWVVRTEIVMNRDNFTQAHRDVRGSTIRTHFFFFFSSTSLSLSLFLLLLLFFLFVALLSSPLLLSVLFFFRPTYAAIHVVISRSRHVKRTHTRCNTGLWSIDDWIWAEQCTDQ